jgi:hypothetical protein
MDGLFSYLTNPSIKFASKIVNSLIKLSNSVHTLLLLSNAISFYILNAENSKIELKKNKMGDLLALNNYVFKNWQEKKIGIFTNSENDFLFLDPTQMKIYEVIYKLNDKQSFTLDKESLKALGVILSTTPKLGIVFNY